MGNIAVTQASDCVEGLTRLYKLGMPPGFSTGWDTLNEFYTVMPGQFTLITGVPSHGKSTWLECLSVNLAWMGWKFVVYSPEHEPPEVHLATFCEKILHKPFRQGFNGQMTPSEVAQAVAFMDEHYRFLRIPEGEGTIPSLQDILEAANPIFRQWINENHNTHCGLIIDPWGDLRHEYQEQETKYIGEQLHLFRRCCRAWNCHGFLVAHPKQMTKHPRTGEYPIPRPYDISGSAHWNNRADCCITVWRSENDADDVEIHIQKVKFRHVGKRGMVSLSFNCADGTYADIKPHWATPSQDHRAWAAGE